MFKTIKDFLEWRRQFKPIQGKPIALNLRANSPATIMRHYGRILRILQTLQKESLAENIRTELEKEFNQRKASLAVIGTVLPDNIEAIQKAYDDFMRTDEEQTNG